jgi:hypothetical protein
MLELLKKIYSGILELLEFLIVETPIALAGILITFVVLEVSSCNNKMNIAARHKEQRITNFCKAQTGSRSTSIESYSQVLTVSQQTDGSEHYIVVCRTETSSPFSNSIQYELKAFPYTDTHN